MQDEVMLLENYSEKHRAAVSSFFAEFAEAGENAREEAFGGFSYTFLYIREADGRLVGMLNLRGNRLNCDETEKTAWPEETDSGSVKKTETGVWPGETDSGSVRKTETGAWPEETDSGSVKKTETGAWPEGRDSESVKKTEIGAWPKETESGSVKNAGNIGYSIRPSERGKGYGTALVESGLELCDMFGIKNPTAVVKKDNIASRRVLEKNGFVLKKEDGEVLVWEHL